MFSLKSLDWSGRLFSVCLLLSCTKLSKPLDLKSLDIRSSAVILIPGISGDLGRRNIMPALYNILRRDKDRKNKCVIIGLGRRDSSPEKIFSRAKEFIKDYDEQEAKYFLDHFFYLKADLKGKNGFQDLKNFIEIKEQELGLKNNLRLVYLSVPSEAFLSYLDKFTESSIISAGNSRHLVAFEKPVGQDVASARKIIKYISSKLVRNQVFYIDHHRASMLSEVPGIVSSNVIFKSAWNNKFIKRVELYMDETLGMEGRGKFYDNYGAVKDVFQNHLLQIATSVGLADKSFSSVSVEQKARARFISSLKLKRGILGQYKGYLDEPGVNKDSKTETFAALEFEVDTPQWSGVPFFVRSGKKLARSSAEILIEFKDTKKKPGLPTGSKSSGSILKFHVSSVSPSEFVELELKTGKNKSVVLASPKKYGVNEYLEIFDSLLGGLHTFDVGEEEIMAQWDLTDAILNSRMKLRKYEPGSIGFEKGLIRRLGDSGGPVKKRSSRPVSVGYCGCTS